MDPKVDLTKKIYLAEHLDPFKDKPLYDWILHRYGVDPDNFEHEIFCPACGKREENGKKCLLFCVDQSIVIKCPRRCSELDMVNAMSEILKAPVHVQDLKVNKRLYKILARRKKQKKRA
ncbi:MAG: hypothetical protein JW725_01000 [Candidatus Babeliaceae bacterium]|nr:hypothetical protein [Candidatus Babeliaceae bacterium]